MGNDAQDKAAEAARTNIQLEQDIYGLSKPALQYGTSYLTGAYQQGGFNQNAKYQSMLSNAMDQSAQGNILQGNLGQSAAANAMTYSGIGQQKLAAGVDEMNKIRSLLAQKGLRTTNLAQESGAQSVSAIAGMYQGNKTADIIMGGAAAGAAAYGGYQQNQAQNQIAQQLKAQQFFSNPNLGSDRSYLQYPSGGITSFPGGKT